MVRKMHDIICPHCGGRFIASDVAFDLSKYILPLLCKDASEEEAVLNAGFMFFGDEESIVNNTTEDNNAPLFCESQLGPERGDAWYPYVISCRMILDYIQERANLNIDIPSFLKEIKPIILAKKGGLSSLQTTNIKALYQTFFKAYQKSGSFDLEDDNVQTAIKILIHILDNPGKSLTLNVKVYSSKNNPERPDYVIPDRLFIAEGNDYNTLKKCCRFCGALFPVEYGYYKMMPVVLLGSHFAGKTSFLLALDHTITTKPPFNTEPSLKFTHLNDDPDYNALLPNVERYRAGQPPLKTDFKNVPVLNIKANKYIYVFIDWPGEKFISQASTVDSDYVARSKRAITQARHFLCFLEPTQIDHSLKATEENVSFFDNNLITRFQWHMTIPQTNKLHSITYVVNKVDIIEGTPNSEGVMLLMNNKNESAVFSGGVWHDKEFEIINEMTGKYVMNQNSVLYYGFTNMLGVEPVPKAFLPVAPYGRNTDTEETRHVVHSARLAGLPLLNILKKDGLIS